MLFCLTLFSRGGELTAGAPFASHMVLPMDHAVPVWGKAKAASAVAVRFAGKTVQGRADADGRWRLMLPATTSSSEGNKLEVASGDERLVFDDVVVGRVWLCSGQSNMDFALGRAVGGKAEAAKAAGFPAIRLCNLTTVPTDARAYDAATLARLKTGECFTGGWQVATEASASGISAIAWWTARMVYEKTGVPIGLVENAVGGSGAEAWLPQEVLESRPVYRGLLGERWLESDRIGNWTKGRTRQNLGKDLSANHPFKPGFLFESGVREWAGFPFEAVLWYQGESNAELHDDAWNGQLIRDLVTGWRTAFGRKDLPFFMIQLPRIGGADPLRQYWPQFREVQAQAVKALPGTHLIVTQDLGWDSPDVHPPDKLPVAVRLSASILPTLKK